MIDGLKLFTIIHVVISLVGIVSGVPLVYGFLTSRLFNQWTWIFLISTILTSVTGFGFPANQITPAHVLGVISLIVLGLAIFALYVRKMKGNWRSIFILSSVVAFYLNSFVLVVQLFLKVPLLKAIAPSQTDPAFVIVQSTLLLSFVLIAGLSLRRFSPEVEFDTHTSESLEKVQ